MKRILTAIVVAILLALTAVSLAPPTRASTSAPTWTAGDYWVYNVTGFSFGIGSTGSGTYRLDVLGQQSITLASTTYTTYHLKLNVTVTVTQGSTTTTISLPGDIWLRTSDFAPVKQSLSFSFLTSTITETQTNTPPPGRQWPLTPGATWSANYMVESVSALGSIISTTYSNDTASYSVQADTSVTVPAGTFSATPLKEAAPSGSYNLSYWSSTAGGPVREDTVDAFGSTTTSLQLKSYNYQAGGSVGGLFLGLPLLAWIAIIAVIVIVVAALVFLRMRKPRAPQAMMPPQPGAPPMQPGAQPPSGGEQMPPGPPPQP